MAETPTPTAPSALCCDVVPEAFGGVHGGGSALPAVRGEWEPHCDGGGEVPAASDATDAESWVS